MVQLVGAQASFIELVAAPGVTVRYKGEDKVLGVTPDPIPLDGARDPSLPHLLVLEKEGYEPLEISISHADIWTGGGRFPRESELRLTPLWNTRVTLFLQTYAVPLLSGLALALLLAIIKLFSRHKAKVLVGISPRAGKYRLKELLGEGGMAVVYRGLCKGPPGEVAVKILRSELCFEDASKERFKRETKVSSELTHDNLIRIFDWGETADGRLFLVSELFRGETLKSRFMREGRLPVREIFEIMLPLAAAIDYLHSKELVHRDVKPGNIFLTEQGGVKLLDLGIARSVADATLTATGKVIGTPAYMAPERVKGETNPATDQYALGIIAFEALTGRRPFDGEDSLALIKAHAVMSPPSLREFWDGGSDEADAVLRKIFSKEPKDRFESATQAMERLKRAVLDPENTGDTTQDVF